MGTTLVTDLPGGAGMAATVIASVTSMASNAGITSYQPVCRCKNAGSVLSVFFIPSASQAGSATDYRTMTLVNLGSVAGGTTVVASYTALSAAAGSIAANTAGAFTMTTTAANYTVAAGDVLAYNTTSAGNGIATVAGKLQIDFC